MTTEIGARGVDLKGVDCVVLLGLPRTLDGYVHVTGRTAREGRRGAAVSLIFSAEERERLEHFGRELGVRMPITDLGFL